MKRIFYFVLFIIFIILTLLSCATQTKYVRVPMSTPPRKYFILDYNSQNSFELEHINALQKILEWQVWYNAQVNSNYYNYSISEVSNYYFTNSLTNNIKQDIIIK
jgi:hypothetical protein